MNRLHAHIKVDDLEQSIAFYEALFGHPPDIKRPDYAKWMLENPRANIAISPTKNADDATTGLCHLGIETENDAALSLIATRMHNENQSPTPEPDANCCYANSNKFWARAPEGVTWEIFHTLRQIDDYGNKGKSPRTSARGFQCCAPSSNG